MGQSIRTANDELLKVILSVECAGGVTIILFRVGGHSAGLEKYLGLLFLCRVSRSLNHEADFHRAVENTCQRPLNCPKKTVF